MRLKRAYDPPEPDDGYRVLVDRIWPRGVRRDALAIDEWASVLAPTDELRRWFGHRVECWPEFRDRYVRELEDPERARALTALRTRARRGQITLVFGAADREHNQAVVLAEILEREPGNPTPGGLSSGGAGASARDREPIVEALERLLVGGIGVTALALGRAPKAGDMTLPQWRVLVMIAGEDGVHVGELAVRLGVAVPSASRLVRRLEMRGLVEATRDERDRRATTVRETILGRSVREAVLGHRRELILEALEETVGPGDAEMRAAMSAIGDALSRFA